MTVLAAVGSYFGTKGAGSIVKFARKNCVVKSWREDAIVVAMPAKLPAGNTTLVVKNVIGSASLPIVVGP